MGCLYQDQKGIAVGNANFDNDLVILKHTHSAYPDKYGDLSSSV